MKYGLIGEKLSHSFSPEIHAQFSSEEYLLKELAPSEVGEFLLNRDFLGINVTIPYKQTVMEYLDEISPVAKRIGAVNTIVNDNGKLKGYNTDYYGLKFMLSSANITLKGKTVAILGSGGASKTVIALCEDEGAKEILVVSRSGKINYENVSECDVNVIINASPVGMYPNNGGCLVNLNDFPSLEGVADLVYNPATTELLRRAKIKGINNANGLAMLVAQAKKARELFDNASISDEQNAIVTKKLQNQLKNIVLVGMPGSGKTTIGKAIARKTNRTFIDTDVEFEKETGITCSQYITQYGEQAFRDKETQVVERVAKLSKCVIATGGGAVLREQNRIALQSNSTIVWIKRNLDGLPLTNRPLSKDRETIKKMYSFRAPIYQSVCDFQVENVTVSAVVSTILNSL